MVISKLRDMITNGAGKAGGPNTANDPADVAALNPNKEQGPISRAAKKEVAEPKAPPPIQLNIGPYTHIADRKTIDDKSAQKILRFYQQGEEVKNKAGEMVKTEAFFEGSENQLLVHVSAPVATAKLANNSIFKRFTSLFSSFRVNEALNRLQDGNEIDLISEGNEATDPRMLKKLTKAGVYSYVMVYNKNEKGNFSPKPDLIIPVMDLHALLEYLKANIPKGIPKEVHAQFKADIDALEANPRLKDVMFIDEALALKENKDKYETEAELRKALCSATDILSLNSEVLVSSDLIGQGPEGKAQGKEYSAFNFNYPVIAKDGKASIVEHPMTLVRNENRKSEELPPELNRVLQWHFMSQLSHPEKIGEDKGVLPMLREAFEKNATVLKKFSAAHSDSTSGPKKEEKNFSVAA